MDLPLVQKNKKLNLFWNIIPQNNYAKKISELFSIYKYLDIDEYIQKILMSKIYINTLSPYELISPRYFETFASSTILLCEDTELYSRVFKNEFEYFTFKNDLSDFNSKIDYILNNFSSLDSMIQRNKKIVYENHTWENRVNKINSIINKF